MTLSPAAVPRRGGARGQVQRCGAFLSEMVMRNIAAFLAWGLIAALFTPNGWLPNETLGGLAGPMLTYLLPLLIANSGGRILYGTRGGVVAAIATVGVIVGTDIPMLLGAMIVGPLAALALKQLDRRGARRIRTDLRPLVDSLSTAIVGGVLAVLTLLGVRPAVEWLSGILAGSVDFLVTNGLLPLTSLFLEPGKILLLDTAIDDRILTPLGTQQAGEAGKSILFLLDANPGPGLGILIAYCLFGIGLSRASAPGAILIQFLGGIREICVPYLLAKPLLVIAAIAGGMTGIVTNIVLGSGLRAPASPGSIIETLVQTPSDSLAGVTLSVLLSAAVSCVIASVILRASRPARE